MCTDFRGNRYFISSDPCQEERAIQAAMECCGAMVGNTIPMSSLYLLCISDLVFVNVQGFSLGSFLVV